MLDIDLEEELVQKVGGKFALTSLLQRRLVELNRGDPPLVKVDDADFDNRRIACEEILQGKIALAPRRELQHAAEEAEEEKIPIEAASEEEAQGEDAEIYGSDIKKIKEQRIKELSQLLNPNKK